MALPTLDVTGNLTADVELRYSQNGVAVGNGTVAANRSRKNEQTGEWDTLATLFQRFTAFGDNAELLAGAGKGTKVRLVGSLETEQWQDKNTGENRSATKLKVDFCAVFKRQEPQGWGQQGQQQSQQQPQQGGWQQIPPVDPWAQGGGDVAPPF